jgi:hypothetical protein
LRIFHRLALKINGERFYLLKLSQTGGWCALQGSNLRKTGDSLGNSDSPSPIASLELGGAFHGLDLVVETWPKLSAPLKAAIVAIVNSTFPAAPPPATGIARNSADTTNNKQEIT